MKLTRHWLPYHMQIHSSLRSLVHCNTRGQYVVSLRARNAKGEILQEHRLNHGEPITGVSSMMLDYAVFEACMKASVEGSIETTFLSDAPCGDVCSYYQGSRGFTSFLNNALPSLNHSNRPHRYRGFSVHLVTPAVRTCGLVVMNISTDIGYSRGASFQYELLNKQGEVVQTGSQQIAPFGSCWLAINEGLLKKNGEAMYTMFGRCDGSALMSFIYTVMEGGGLGIEHTQPPQSQLNYGEDLTPGVRHRYLRMRERLARKMRYRFNRFDDHPVMTLRPSGWKRISSVKKS